MRSVSREIRLGLGRKADDEIGGEREIRPRGAQPLDRAQIIRARMPAIHRAEDPVRARLHRQMELRRKLRQIAVHRDQIIIDVARMTGGVAQPRDAGDFGDATQQLPERPGAAVPILAVIRVDVLADQRHLAHASHRRGFVLLR